MATKKKAGEQEQADRQGRAREGKLGVMVVGLGAVATTMIAGVEAVRQGLAKPVGSLIRWAPFAWQAHGKSEPAD